jgi:hypothetical protein
MRQAALMGRPRKPNLDRLDNVDLRGMTATADAALEMLASFTCDLRYRGAALIGIEGALSKSMVLYPNG